MSRHSVAEARNRLSSLIERALAGEDVVITRHGHPVVELRPVGRRVAPLAAADLDWLAVRRPAVPPGGEATDAGALLSRMRDDEDR